MSVRSRLGQLLDRRAPDPVAPPGLPHPAPQHPAPRPLPAPGANSFVLVVLDSCRYDSFMAANPRVMSKLGRVERRYSYASWTSPSHYNLLMGLLPHPSPAQVFASEHYKHDLARFRERLGVDGVSFLEMVPRLWLPHTLQAMGYATEAYVSLPVLNPATPLNADFDHFQLMDRHNDLAAILSALRFPPDRPRFVLINAGETHYPYALPDEPEAAWPRIHGPGGVWKEADAALRAGAPVPARLLDQARLDALRARQVEAVRHVDRAMEALFDAVPPGTWITITSDHGECFGEAGYFGHGPIFHEKVFEVPLVEGRIR